MSALEPFIDRLLPEGRELVQEAAGRDLSVRLMGGVGIRLRLGARYPAEFERPYRDLDILVRKKESRQVERLLQERGWEPATAFNALSGARRLLFEDPVSDAQVDVFVEAFEMCHKLPLADGLERPGPALPVTDLLMTKLQIIELNAKDRGDCYALLAGADTGDGDASLLEPHLISAIARQDWGIYHTFELNLSRLSEGLERGVVPEPHRQQITAGIAAVTTAMEEAPKSRGWKLRARIGERKQWYEEPEEVDRATPG